MKECIRVHSTKEDGSDMRPGTPTADKHWTWMLALSYDTDHVQVCGSHEPNGGPELNICRKFPEENPDGFEHIMKFIKSNNLTFSVDYSECAKCSRNQYCVAEEK